MAPLKTFNLVQASLNRLAVNIETLGVSNAMMKIGEQYVYEDNLKKPRNRRGKKGALSDDNEEIKDNGKSEQLPTLGQGENRKRGRSNHQSLRAADSNRPLGIAMQLGDGLLTEGNETDRTEKTQSGGSQDGDRRKDRRGRLHTGVLDDMEEDEEFVALDSQRQRSHLKSLDGDELPVATKSDVASLGGKEEKLEPLKKPEPTVYRDDTLYAAVSKKRQKDKLSATQPQSELKSATLKGPVSDQL